MAEIRYRPRLVVIVAALAFSVAGCTSKDGGFMQGFRVTPKAERTTGTEYTTFETAIVAAKASFRDGDYGLAETAYRRSVELNANSGEAWLGLAASYDRLRRFDLADRAYRQAATLIGDTPAYYNNLGYSYLLRGDLMKARQNFDKARGLDPENVVVAHNIEMMRASIGYTASIQ
jgi:Flp pilus assembly protein TadD